MSETADFMYTSEGFFHKTGSTKEGMYVHLITKLYIVNYVNYRVSQKVPVSQKKKNYFQSTQVMKRIKDKYLRNRASFKGYPVCDWTTIYARSGKSMLAFMVPDRAIVWEDPVPDGRGYGPSRDYSWLPATNNRPTLPLNKTQNV